MTALLTNPPGTEVFCPGCNCSGVKAGVSEEPVIDLIVAALAPEPESLPDA